MKKNFLPLIAIILLLVNCTKEDFNSNPTVSDAELKQPTALNKLSSGATTTSFTKAGTKYSNEWKDEFTGTILSTTNWKVEKKWKTGQLVGGYKVYWNYDLSKPDYVISGGSIKFKTSFIDIRNTTEDVISCGGIQAKNNFKYGYFEAKMKMPTPEDHWGAFWLMPTDGAGMIGNIIDNNKGDDGAEIDIAEGNKSTSYSHGIHIDGYGSDKNGWAKETANATSTEWHIYGMKWTAAKITYYRDDVEIVSIPASTKPRISQAEWAPDVNHFIRLNSDASPGGDWVGGTWRNNSTTRGNVEVDWVKVYYN